MFYMIKYVTKDSVELNALLAIVLHARRHIDEYTSRAADATVNPEQRRSRHLLTRVKNMIDNEMSDTFAGSLCLGYSADESSETYVDVDLTLSPNGAPLRETLICVVLPPSRATCLVPVTSAPLAAGPSPSDVCMR
jgi:hypothetical protein